MVEVNFKSTTRTVNLLGRDNVLDYRSAILELVKNSYDAFSPRVDIKIDGKKQVKRAKDAREDNIDFLATTIEIVDYGNGMNLEKIIDVFFTLGTDDKTNVASLTLNEYERVMNGSMGIGRLSLGRLGNVSKVITSDGSKAYSFIIDWNKFNTGAPLETVKVDIEELTLEEFSNEYTKRNFINNENRGTILISQELNDDWLRSDKYSAGTNYSLLKLTLNKLKNPLKLGNSGDFNIYLDYFGDNEKIEPSFEDVSTDAQISFAYSHVDDMLILEGYFDEIDINQLPPDFVNSKFDELKDYIIDENGQKRDRFHFEQEYKITEYLPEEIPINPIGDFDGNLYFTKKNAPQNYPFIKGGTFKLNEFDIEPGILLFRDGFRIRPYGEENTIGFDWLGIEKVRSKNPSGVGRKNYIMQANQLSGYVNITKEKNSSFEDQANREGLKQSSEFKFLQQLILRIIKDFSSIRSNIAILYNKFLEEKADIEYHSEIGKKTKRKLDALVAKYQGDVQKLYKDPEYKTLTSNPNTLFEIYSLQDTTAAEKDSLVNESDTLRTMATQGIVMSTFAHQIKNDKNFFKNIPQNLIEIGNEYSRKLKYDFHNFEVDFNLYDYSEAITRKTTSILGFIESSVNSPTRDKKENINLVSYLFKIFRWWDGSVRNNFYEYEYLVNGKKSPEELSKDFKNIFVYASETQLDSIFLNLITNSYKSFKNLKQDCVRRINVNLNIIDEKKIEIIYEDNGNGLSSKIKDKNIIFEAFKTYNKEGTGMGMWILSSVVSNLKGQKEILSEPGEHGFKMKIILKGGV